MIGIEFFNNRYKIRIELCRQNQNSAVMNHLNTGRIQNSTILNNREADNVLDFDEPPFDPPYITKLAVKEIPDEDCFVVRVIMQDETKYCYFGPEIWPTLMDSMKEASLLIWSDKIEIVKKTVKIFYKNSYIDLVPIVPEERSAFTNILKYI